MIHVAQSTKQWAESNFFQLFYSESVDSTNSQAKKDGIISSTSPWIYLTETQTQGRGRGTNTWTNTDAGNHLLCTWCYDLPSSPQPIAVPLFGWAVYQALNDEFDMALSVKAPNDIWAGDKKLAGLLIESVSQGDKHAIFVGLGLNVNDAPKDIPNATSMFDEIGTSLNVTRWHSFLDKLRVRFNEVIQVCTLPELSGEYRNEILAALKKWPGNKVDKLLSNGDLVLNDSTRMPWNKL